VRNPQDSLKKTLLLVLLLAGFMLNCGTCKLVPFL
jgi:hypothetical protein